MSIMSNLAMLRRNTPVLEEIAFQGKNFGLALENIFEEMLSKKLKDSEAHDQYAERLEAVILEHTNMTIKVLMTHGDDDDDSWSEPAMFTNVVNNGHVFNQDENNSWLFNTLKDNDADRVLSIVANKDTVSFNLKTGRLTGLKKGIFLGTLFLRWKMVRWVKFDAAELASIVIHEVGHVATMFEFIGRTTTANAVLGALLKSVRDDSVEARKIVFKKAATVIGGDINLDGYETIKDVSVITTVVIDACYDGRVSLNGSSAYDCVVAEQVADQYVSRMGYGRQFMSAFTKKRETFNYKNTDRSISNIARRSADFMELSTYAVLGLISVATLAAPINIVLKTVLAAGVYAGLSKLFTKGANEINNTELYDTPRVRMLRIREDAVTYLKNCSLPKEAVKAKLDEIEQMDDVIKKYLSTDYKSYQQVVMEFLFKKNRDIASAKDLQRKLEELSANDLFVQSAKLKAMI